MNAHDRWLLVASCAAIGCVTLGSPAERVAGLEREAMHCADFVEFEAQARRVAEELPEPSARLEAARLQCARAVVDSLLLLREERGAEAAQQQLDEMALSLSPQAFDGVISAAAVDSNLRAMAALASATAATSRSQLARAGHEQAAIDSWRVEVPRQSLNASVPSNTQVNQCEVLAPDSALSCLTELSSHLLEPAERERLAEVAQGAAKQKVKSLQVVPPAQQALPLSKWLARLEAIEVSEPTLVQALERAHQAAWPGIEAAKTAGQLERAAVEAAPFLSLPGAREAVEALRAEAKTHQLELAARAGPRVWAAAFHRRVAMRFGGAAAGWPEGTAGQWDATRFQCARAPGALPPAGGLQLRLVARCQRSKREPDAAAPADPNMKTFEGERDLEWENIDGTLFVSCAGRVLSYRLSLHDLAVDTGQNQSALRDEPGVGAAPQSALSLELQKLISRAQPECRAAREQQARNDCSMLNRGEPFELEARFSENAVALKEWPACFTQWLEERFGFAPPALE